MKALIVDDEPIARRELRRLLTAHEDVEVAGEAGSAAEAERALASLGPDLMFLDIRMPQRTGLQLLESLDDSPQVIFTTAHDEHALQAFELGALDYLLKPFGRERFAVMLERVRRRLGVPGDDAERARQALGPLPLGRLFARVGDRAVPIPVDTIVRAQARGDYSEVYCAAGTFLLHVSLTELLARLDPARFSRVHRSHVVNIEAVEYLRDYGDRRLLVRMRDGAEIVASRTASQDLKRMVR